MKLSSVSLVACFSLTVYPQSRLELILLKQDLVHRLLDRREVKVRLSDDDAGVGEIHLDSDICVVLSKHSICQGLLRLLSEDLYETNDTKQTHLEHFLPKEVIPHFPLDVPVHQITLTQTTQSIKKKKTKKNS